MIVGDLALAPLARKLRMAGVDALIAGEAVRAGVAATVRSSRKGGGLGRVKIESERIKPMLQRAAVEGRLIVHGGLSKKQRAHGALPGVAYELMSPSTNVAAQFAEILELFNLTHLVDSGGSRCGICNADTWRVVDADEAEALGVPPGVLRETPEYYLCETCKQLFWAGPKYEGAMQELRDAV